MGGRIVNGLRIEDRIKDDGRSRLIVIATTIWQIVVATYAMDLGKSFLGVKMTREMKGVCFLFSETGTEGGWWAMQEDGFVTEDGHWKYEGLQYLRDGDDFTVYADDGRGYEEQLGKTDRTDS